MSEKITLSDIQNMTDKELVIACKSTPVTSCKDDGLSLCYCCAVGIELEKRRHQAVQE